MNISRLLKITTLVAISLVASTSHAMTYGCAVAVQPEPGGPLKIIKQFSLVSSQTDTSVDVKIEGKYVATCGLVKQKDLLCAFLVDHRSATAQSLNLSMLESSALTSEFELLSLGSAEIGADRLTVVNKYGDTYYYARCER